MVLKQYQIKMKIKKNITHPYTPEGNKNSE